MARAIGWGNPEMVKLLLDSGANPERKYKDAMSPLENIEWYLTSYGYGPTSARKEIKKLIEGAIQKK